MSNNRIYYACQSVELYPAKDVNTNLATSVNKDAIYSGTPLSVQGLQSVGMNTNFNLEPVYQLGQLSLYDNYEEIPEVEISLNKVLDGRSTLYGLAMGTGSLTRLANRACGVRLTLYPDTSTNASGDPVGQVRCAPAYLSSVTYSFPSEGNFTEEVQLVSNEKEWVASPSAGSTAPTVEDAGNNPGIMRRQQLNLSASTLPTGVSGGIPEGYKIQNINVSVNLGRESIFNLGERTPSFRYINFPVEVTCEFEVVAKGGDLVGVTEGNADPCTNPKALMNKSIVLTTCDGMVLDLGTKNKLTSVNYQGGDTGGGNATITYSYQTFNDFIYTSPTSGSPAPISAQSVVDNNYVVDYNNNN
jgi:hypothetical protein